MKRTILFLGLSIATGFAATAQVSTAIGVKAGMIGDIKVEKFTRLNAKGSEMVMAINATSTPLSAADQALMMQVAMGGMKQLAISQAALQKATNPQVKLLAQSEVEEQTTVANKLKQIAAAKGITLPTAPDASVQALLTRLQGLSGAQVDAFYLAQSGIQGHQELETTMTTVRRTATDPALKALAKATLPVIKVHLRTSQQVQASMGGATNSTGL